MKLINNFIMKSNFLVLLTAQIKKAFYLFARLKAREKSLLAVLWFFLLGQCLFWLIDFKQFLQIQKNVGEQELSIKEFRQNRKISDEKKLIISQDISNIKVVSFRAKTHSIAELRAVQTIEQIASDIKLSNMTIEHIDNKPQGLNFILARYQIDANYDENLFWRFVKKLSESEKAITINYFAVAGTNYQRMRLQIEVLLYAQGNNSS